MKAGSLTAENLRQSDLNPGEIERQNKLIKYLSYIDYPYNII
jgi:hypothetical protein